MSPRCEWCAAQIELDEPDDGMPYLCRACDDEDRAAVDRERRELLRSIAEDHRVDEYIDRRRGVL